MKLLAEWERMPASEYAAWRQRRLFETLDYAHRLVPLYRSGVWAQALAGRDHRELAHWPVLEKAHAIAETPALQVNPRPPGTCLRISSASTGPSLRLSIDPPGAAWSWANEFRALQWYGIEVGDRTLISMHNMHQLPRERVFHDWVRNRKACFADHLTPARLEDLARCLMQGEIRLCWGLPSVMFQLARHVEAVWTGPRRSWTKVIKVGGEPLYAFQRRALVEILGGQVVENYGCTEAGSIASECPRGNLHIFDTHVHVEIFDGDRPLPDGELGDIVITSLTNRAMPLVRCRVGDQGRLSPDPCPCGMPHRVLAQIKGRATDTFAGPDGRRVHARELEHALDGFFQRTSPRQARQAQLIQESPAKWRILVEALEPITDQTRAAAAGIVEQVFGSGCEVAIEQVDMIPRERSGKFRYCRVHPGSPAPQRLEPALA